MQKILWLFFLVLNSSDSFCAESIEDQNRKQFYKIISSKEQIEYRKKIVIENLNSLKQCMKEKLYKDCSRQNNVKTFLPMHYTVCADILAGTEWLLPRKKLPVTEVFENCLGIFKKISDKDERADYEKIVSYKGKKMKALDAVNDLIIRHEIDEIIQEVKTGKFYKPLYSEGYPASPDNWERRLGEKIDDEMQEGVTASIYEYREFDPNQIGDREHHPIPKVYYFYQFKDLQKGDPPRAIKKEDLKKIKIILIIESAPSLRNFFNLEKN